MVLRYCRSIASWQVLEHRRSEEIRLLAAPELSDLAGFGLRLRGGIAFVVVHFIEDCQISSPTSQCQSSSSSNCLFISTDFYAHECRGCCRKDDYRNEQRWGCDF